MRGRDAEILERSSPRLTPALCWRIRRSSRSAGHSRAPSKNHVIHRIDRGERHQATPRASAPPFSTEILSARRALRMVATSIASCSSAPSTGSR